MKRIIGVALLLIVPPILVWILVESIFRLFSFTFQSLKIYIISLNSTYNPEYFRRFRVDLNKNPLDDTDWRVSAHAHIKKVKDVVLKFQLYIFLTAPERTRKILDRSVNMCGLVKRKNSMDMFLRFVIEINRQVKGAPDWCSIKEVTLRVLYKFKRILELIL